MTQAELEQAEELLRKGRYPQAIERFRILLSSDPENPEMRGRVAEAYRLAGNAERAFHHFNKAALIFSQRADIQGACRMLKAANQVTPNQPEILYRLAECLRSLQNFAEFESLLWQLTQVANATGDRRRVWALDELHLIHPEDLDLAVNRATALGEAGRIDEAITAWKRVSSRLDQRGVDFVPMLQHAASIAPDRPDIGVDLAGILLAYHRPREALVMLVPYYEKYPDDIGVLEALLNSLISLNAVDKINPARIELLKARTKQGQRDAAVKDIRQLIATAPTDTNALEVCAHSYTSFGLGQEAMEIWNRLIAIYNAHGRKYERDRAILSMLKEDPNDPTALELGAKALRDAGRIEEAVVLEKRLGGIRASRARPPVAQPIAPASRAETSPFREPSRPPIHRMPPSAVMLDDNDIIVEETTGSLAAYEDRFGSEEPTIPPDEQIGLLMPSELSEPEMEALPLSQNPYTDGLELEEEKRRATVEEAEFSHEPTNKAHVDPSLIEASRRPDSEEGIEIDLAPDDLWAADRAQGVYDPLHDADLAMEAPGSVEETTASMEVLVREDLEELRKDLSQETNPYHPSDSSPPPVDFDDPATVQSTLIEDLKKG